MTLAGFEGPSAQCAVGAGDQILFFVMVIATAMGSAICGVASRYFGARDYVGCKLLALTAICMMFIVGLVSTLIPYFFAEQVVELIGCSATVKTSAQHYVEVCSLANLPFSICLGASAFFRAINRCGLATITQFVTAALSNLLSVWLFGSEHTSLSHSITSLAIAWNVGAWSGAVFALMALRKCFCDKRRLGFEDLTGRDDKMEFLQRENIFRIKEQISILVRQTAPVVMSELIVLISNLTLFCLVSRFSPSESSQAAFAIRLKIEEMFGMLPSLAFASIVVVSVGQHVGAANRILAEKVANKISIYAVFTALLAGLCCNLFAEGLASFFSEDNSCKQILIDYLRWNVILFPVTAYFVVITAALDGAGLSVKSMKLNVLFVLFLKTSLILTFSFGCGMLAAGLTFGMCASYVLAIPFLRGSLRNFAHVVNASS